MAAAATVEIETGPETIADAFGFVEILLSDLEKDLFLAVRPGSGVLLRRAPPRTPGSTCAKADVSTIRQCGEGHEWPE